MTLFFRLSNKINLQERTRMLKLVKYKWGKYGFKASDKGEITYVP
jgi:hypothetical protein